MSEIPTLGTLQLVSLREAWPHEATSFTPWLHESENMSALGLALGFGELTPVGREQAVGPFSADLLAMDQTGNRVLIENQLEQSDHDHLGKCLTYAAGLKASTVIWLCSKVRDEHRAAIDWLNEVSSDEYAFFAVEIELYRIGDSDLAPRFNVAANPNNWTREVRQKAKIAEGELTPAQQENRAYWLGIIQRASGKYAALAARVPYKGTSQLAEVLDVNSLFRIHVYVGRSRVAMRAEYYMTGPSCKLGFDYFREAIEEDGLLKEYDLSFERNDDRTTSKIVVYRKAPLGVTSQQIEMEQDWAVETAADLAEVAHNLMIRLRTDPTPLEEDPGDVD